MRRWGVTSHKEVTLLALPLHYLTLSSTILVNDRRRLGERLPRLSDPEREIGGECGLLGVSQSMLDVTVVDVVEEMSESSSRSAVGSADPPPATIAMAFSTFSTALALLCSSSGSVCALVSHHSYVWHAMCVPFCNRQQRRDVMSPSNL